MEKLHFIATSTFGLEATVKREVMKIGGGDIRVLDGRIDFTGTMETIAEANTWLRSADRVLLNIGEFSAVTFDELFEKTKALPWDEWIPKDGKFTVIGKSIRSALFSVSDCQAIVKKAVVEKLKQKYKCSWFEETGPEYKIQVGLLKDTATLVIDTTGAGLHKRGYRELVGAAPLKETLAYALIELSYWKKDRILLDPVCGTGTIPIEAALAAKNMAPGLSRTFVSMDWPQMDKKIWQNVRAKAYDSIDKTIKPEIYGSDIDPRAIEQSRYAADKAGVGDCIRFETKALRDVVLPGQYGCLIGNPPYGERLGTRAEVYQLYEDLSRLMKKDITWSTYIITSDETFEKIVGKKADAKRKLFNGMMRTDYYQYYGPRPPKKGDDKSE